MAEWTIPPTWNEGQPVSSLDLTDYGQGNLQFLYDQLPHGNAGPVSFSHAGPFADNTSQNRKSLGTLTLTTQGNDVLFVSNATYATGRLLTIRRGTRTTYTTGGITTTDVSLPGRTERARTGQRLNSKGREAADNITRARELLTELRGAGSATIHYPYIPGFPTQPLNTITFRSELFIYIIRQQRLVRENEVTVYDEITYPGGTRQVQTVAPTHVQTTGFVVNQNTYYRQGTIIASFNNLDYVIWHCENPNNTNAREFQRFIILPNIPAGTHTMTLSYIGEMSGLSPRTATPDPDEVRWSGIRNITITAKEIVGKTRA